MKNLCIRQATIEDIDMLALAFDSYRVFYGCTSSINEAKAFLTDRFKNLESTIFIAVNYNGICVGFTQLYPSLSSVSMKKVYILNDLFVSPEYRKQNIGSLLIDKAIEYAKIFDSARVTLTTEITNIIAQSLYEKSGFSFDDENKVYQFFL